MMYDIEVIYFDIVNDTYHLKYRDFIGNEHSGEVTSEFIANCAPGYPVADYLRIVKAVNAFKLADGYHPCEVHDFPTFKCECGSGAESGPMHSHWCPIKEDVK